MTQTQFVKTILLALLIISLFFLSCKTISDPLTRKVEGRIAFQSYRDGNYEIYIVNIDGSELTNLTNNPAEDMSPVFSPDGSKIAFTSRRDGSGGIYIMNYDGSEQTNLSNHQENYEDYPIFQPIP